MSPEPHGKISLVLGGARKQQKSAPTHGVKRSHAALREEDDDRHDEGRAQTVSHFDQDAGGAIDEANKQQETGPLVIAPQANRDWRDASQRKRQRHGLPSEAQQQGMSEQAIKEVEARKPAFGLVVANRDNEDDEKPTLNGHDAQIEADKTQPQASESKDENSVQAKTDDELAMDALLGRTTRQDLVLPAVSEEEAFERDVQTAPDMASLDDYLRVPVEQFGAALLRGMGWKDGEGIGAERGKKAIKTKVPERRPALLGIGAKEEAAVAQEMGTWGKAAKKGGEIKVYNPVLLRDKKTGETYTEEELQKKWEREEREKYEKEFDRKEREKKERRRRREDEEDGRGDRDRRRERGRREDGERRRRDEDDEEDRRRRDKERRRRRERSREDGDRDREPSRRYESDHGRQRERQDRDRRR